MSQKKAESYETTLTLTADKWILDYNGMQFECIPNNNDWGIFDGDIDLYAHDPVTAEQLHCDVGELRGYLTLHNGTADIHFSDAHNIWEHIIHRTSKYTMRAHV